MKKQGNSSNSRYAWQLLLAVLLLAVMIGVMGWLQWRMSSLPGTAAQTEQSYRYHFAMVMDDDESPFWQLVFDGAQQRAQTRDALVERTCGNVHEAFSMEEQLQIAAYAGVDGILAAADGRAATEEAIGEITGRVQGAIPVITMAEDDSGSGRTGYVGINHYEQGRAYGTLIAGLDKPVQRVMLLSAASERETSDNVLYASLIESLAEHGLSDRVTVQLSTVDHQNIFASESGIKQLFRSGDVPEVLICPDYRFTVSAAKVLVEQNLVGQVNLLGASMSSDILEYVRKGTITAVVTVDPWKLGSTAVDEMLELMESGRTSDFTTLETMLIDQSNVERYADAFAEGDA